MWEAGRRKRARDWLPLDLLDAKSPPKIHYTGLTSQFQKVEKRGSKHLQLYCHHQNDSALKGGDVIPFRCCFTNSGGPDHSLFGTSSNTLSTSEAAVTWKTPSGIKVRVQRPTGKLAKWRSPWYWSPSASHPEDPRFDSYSTRDQQWIFFFFFVDQRSTDR